MQGTKGLCPCPHNPIFPHQLRDDAPTDSLDEGWLHLCLSPLSSQKGQRAAQRRWTAACTMWIRSAGACVKALSKAMQLVRDWRYWGWDIETGSLASTYRMDVNVSQWRSLSGCAVEQPPGFEIQDMAYRLKALYGPKQATLGTRRSMWGLSHPNQAYRDPFPLSFS